MDDSRAKKLYRNVLDKDWNALKEDLLSFQKDEEGLGLLLQPISVHGDTIIHLIVHSGTKEPLEQILGLDTIKNDLVLLQCFKRRENYYGNTVLHEAAISGNLEAVKLLVENDEEVLMKVNDSNETPLFRAAAFGNTKIVKFLASCEGQTVTSDDGTKQLRDVHRKNKNGDTVLFAAVQGQHFGTALELLKIDEKLTELEDGNQTSFNMLAQIPSAFIEMSIWKKLLFLCLPVGCDHNDDSDIKYQDIESGLHRNVGSDRNIEMEEGDTKCGLVRLCPTFFAVLYCIYLSIWRYIFRAKKIWKEKRDHVFSRELARKLMKKDKYVCKQNLKDEDANPLFAAIRAGNVKVVKLILKKYPQALEQINYKKQNILHLAAMYRQKEIFNLVKTNEIPMIRLARQIDDDGYTILHSVADTRHYKGWTRSIPAYKLQEELKWFHSVKEIMPSSYIMLRAKNKMTALEILEKMHAEQLKKAQSWIKETSQSCSGVAVLVATVVFAAAFTVPGGTNDNNGFPILLHSPLFMFFTALDVLSLSCSLTSVVMFLSILTSPFELDDFRASLPRKLTFGFMFLFISVAATMLTFTITIVLIIRLDGDRKFPMILLCSAAFCPVYMLALTHFSLISSYIKEWVSSVIPKFPRCLGFFGNRSIKI